MRFGWGDPASGATVNRPRGETRQGEASIELKQIGGGLSVADVYHHPCYHVLFAGRDSALLQYVPSCDPDPAESGQWALHRRGMTLRFPPPVRSFEATRAWLLEGLLELMAFLKAG